MRGGNPDNQNDKNLKLIVTKKGGKRGSKKPNPFWTNIFTTLLIFIVLISFYSLIVENRQEISQVSISELASDVESGLVASITVEGNKVEATYRDQTVKRSQKESGTAISETFANYGVTTEALRNVDIEVEREGGFLFWLVNLAPIIIPLVFIILFLWFITRQVKGAGMQAFTFGQSKARITFPHDKKQRVTFKDVAGVKEAKEELTEIVDFLRNPKKFLDIGARIPKGVLLMGAPGTGKCVTGKTLLLTNKGPISIEDVPKYFSVNRNNTVEGLEIVSLEPKNLTFNKTHASHWYNLGEQETVVAQTDLGVTLEGTPEHPVVVVDEATGNFVFKELTQIKEGEWMVVGYNTNIFGSYSKVPSESAAYLLGALLGDGGMTTKGRISFTTADKEVLDRIQETSKKYLGKNFTKTSSGEYDYELRSVEAKRILIDWGLVETYAENKKIPEWIKLAPKSYVTAFLRGLFDTDGSVEKSGAVTFSSASERLVEEIHSILLNVGIVARIYERKKKYNGKKHSYITVYGDFVEKFQQEIGFSIKRKAERLRAVCVRQRNTNINVFPHQRSAIQKIWKETVGTTETVLNRTFYVQSLYKNSKRYISGDRMPSQIGLSKFLDSVSELSPLVSRMPEVAILRQISGGQFFFTQVKKLGKGKSTVYDLTVPHTHNFIANGLINHNTLLARAVAGEAGVAFFSISGSEFVEMFVGVGASRVRDLFKMAKQAAPAIIFVDEIDAVGRVRGTGVGGGNDEREQTLNQILVEMDGFEPNEKVIIMAATNRPDVLDPALLRPGRFDRRVVLDLPDRDDREQILSIHIGKKPLAEDVNVRVIAERTPGFSGADIYSLVNEAAILAARENRKTLAQYDFIRSIEKVMLGPERKSHILSKKEKEITAYHEAGHALVASVLPYADPVHKVSIISRGRAAGYTLKLPIEERKLQSKNEFLDDIAVSLAGYITEQMMFKDLTTGSSNDLQVSTALARDMVTKYGMSDKLGAMAFESSGGRAMFGKGIEEREYSNEVAAEIDAEVSRIMREAYEKGKQILTEYKAALDSIAKKLIDVETMERDEFEKILIAHNIELKQKQDIEHQA